MLPWRRQPKVTPEANDYLRTLVEEQRAVREELGITPRNQPTTPSLDRVSPPVGVPNRSCEGAGRGVAHGVVALPIAVLATVATWAILPTYSVEDGGQGAAPHRSSDVTDGNAPDPTAPNNTPSVGPEPTDPVLGEDGDRSPTSDARDTRAGKTPSEDGGSSTAEPGGQPANQVSPNGDKSTPTPNGVSEVPKCYLTGPELKVKVPCTGLGLELGEIVGG